MWLIANGVGPERSAPGPVCQGPGVGWNGTNASTTPDKGGSPISQTTLPVACPCGVGGAWGVGRMLVGLEPHPKSLEAGQRSSGWAAVLTQFGLPKFNPTPGSSRIGTPQWDGVRLLNSIAKPRTPSHIVLYPIPPFPPYKSKFSLLPGSLGWVSSPGTIAERNGAYQ
ncbi:hypothetical protein GX48_01690 [Paracoccidioides brasiliensis]|nr:hypothetical protein GX48_01690 [Paracoccidioides brasiliensis]